MTTYTETYVAISRAFLTKAEVALTQGDLVTGSRKGWYATAYMLRGVARTRGWRYFGSRGLDEVVDRIVYDYGYEDLWGDFASAEALEMNSYENRMSPLTVEVHLAQVRQLLNKLENFPA